MDAPFAEVSVGVFDICADFVMSTDTLAGLVPTLGLRGSVPALR